MTYAPGFEGYKDVTYDLLWSIILTHRFQTIQLLKRESIFDQAVLS